MQKTLDEKLSYKVVLFIIMLFYAVLNVFPVAKPFVQTLPALWVHLVLLSLPERIIQASQVRCLPLSKLKRYSLNPL